MAGPQQQQPAQRQGQQQQPAPPPAVIDDAPQPTARERELMRELEQLRAKSAATDALATARAGSDVPAIKFNDELVRIFLFVQGEGEVGPALSYLAKYADDPDPVEGEPWKPTTVLKTSEVRIDQLNETHVITPIIRNINKDRRHNSTYAPEHPDGKERMVFTESRAPIIECKPVNVGDYYTHATDRRTLGNVDRNALVNAIARACVIGGHALASPRVEKRGDQSGDGNHVYWLVLRWG